MDAPFLKRRVLVIRVLPVLLLLTMSASAQETVFQLDTAQSQVQFSLAATFHAVHGTFRLKDGAIHFNPATGQAGGSLVVDSTSGKTGNDRRDRRMHREILEDQKYPEIVFTLQHFSGKLAPAGASQVELQGLMTLHGQQHPMTITIPVQISQGKVSADAQFVVPYVEWGLKNPSTFVLRVSGKVNVEVHVVGHLKRPAVATGHI